LFFLLSSFPETKKEAPPVPDKPPSSSDLVPPGFHFSDSSYSDAAFDNYLDDMIQEGQDMVKASSDVYVEMDERGKCLKALKESS
jgi:hypothetical protein